MHLFISHRQADLARAEKLKKSLIEVSNTDKLEISISGDGPTKRKALRAADVLLILFADEQTHWNPQGYEAGIFQGYKGDDSDLKETTFIIHSPKARIPNNPPLDATDVKIERDKDKKLKELDERLLEKLYQVAPSGVWGLNPFVLQEAVLHEKVYQAFVEAVGGVQETRIVMREFRITFGTSPPGEGIDRIKLVTLDSATVSGDDDTMRLFGLVGGGGKEHAWKVFQQALIKGFNRDFDNTNNGEDRELDDHTKRWIVALAGRMSRATTASLMVAPGLPLLLVNVPGEGESSHSNNTGKKRSYRPTLYSAETYADGKEVYRIVLTDIPREIDPVPLGLGQKGHLWEMMDIGRMTRWGAVRPFEEAVNQLESVPEAQRKHALIDAFEAFALRNNNLKAEAESKGYNRIRAIGHLLEPVKDEAKKASDRWDKIFNYDEGELKTAAEQGDREKALGLVKEMLNITRIWLFAASEAFHAICANEMEGDLLAFGVPADDDTDKDHTLGSKESPDDHPAGAVLPLRRAQPDC